MKILYGSFGIYTLLLPERKRVIKQKLRISHPLMTDVGVIMSYHLSTKQNCVEDESTT
jgi:hypothetical protein